MYRFIIAGLTVGNLVNPLIAGFPSPSPALKNVALLEKPHFETCKQIYDEHAPRLFVLDNRGTLTPQRYDTTPEEDQKEAEIVKGLLERAAKDRHNEVWLLSAAPLYTLDDFKDLPGINLAAECGTLMIRNVNGKREVAVQPTVNGALELRQEIDKMIEKAGLQIEHSEFHCKNFIMFTHDHPSVPKVSKTLKDIKHLIETRYPDFTYIKESYRPTRVEIRHKSVGKGQFVQQLLSQRFPRFQMGISIADRPMDEGMHEAMNSMGDKKFISVAVDGDDPEFRTCAAYKLESHKEVQGFLEHLFQK